jgi:hypothetical protein
MPSEEMKLFFREPTHLSAKHRGAFSNTSFNSGNNKSQGQTFELVEIYLEESIPGA